MTTVAIPHPLPSHYPSLACSPWSLHTICTQNQYVIFLSAILIPGAADSTGNSRPDGRSVDSILTLLTASADHDHATIFTLQQLLTVKATSMHLYGYTSPGILLKELPMIVSIILPWQHLNASVQL